MPTFQDIQELTEEFNNTVGDAKKNPKLAKLLEYTNKHLKHYGEIADYETKHSAYWKSLSEQIRQDFLEKAQLEIQQHIEFIKSVAEFKKAIDNPVNNPREIEPIRKSKDKHVREFAAKMIPSLKEVLTHAIAALDFRTFLNRTENNRGQVIQYLSQSLNATTDVVNSKFQDPEKLRVMLNFVNPGATNENKQYDTRNFITRTCSQNPEVSQFLALLTVSIGITMILMAGALSGILGALPVTLPIIAAGIALTAFGMKVSKLCDRYMHNNKSKMHQEQLDTGIEKFGAKYTSMIKSDEAKKAYKNADHLVRKAEGIEMQSIAESPRMAARMSRSS